MASVIWLLPLTLYIGLTRIQFNYVRLTTRLTMKDGMHVRLRVRIRLVARVHLYKGGGGTA